MIQRVQCHLARLRHVRDAVRSGSDKTEKRFDSVGNPDFGRHLRDHACGFLAPMILEMTIRWPSLLLQNSLELVDLPGDARVRRPRRVDVRGVDDDFPGGGLDRGRRISDAPVR